jgi:hypothetical protein
MRMTGLILLAALAVTLAVSVDAVCCADEDGCLDFCACLCCNHIGLYIDPSISENPAADATFLQAAGSAIPASFRLSPDLPPPRS